MFSLQLFCRRKKKTTKKIPHSHHVKIPFFLSILRSPPQHPSAAALSLNVAPQWVDISTEVQQGIADIKTRMAKLQQVHSKVMLTTFEESDVNEQEVEIMTQEASRVPFDLLHIMVYGHYMDVWT